ncbi:ATP-binding protein [Streptomyces sp. B6B3]|uniref:ATP-binding protein n=1 Tax=Streptomyces sp. B6B3 TaxID=3153570 RepID=UPI00325F63E4
MTLARSRAAQAYTAYPWIDVPLVALLVSEAATNAVLHGEGADFYVLCHSPSPVDRSVQVEVRDSGTDFPRRRQATELDEGGRGLALLDMLAAGWRAERTTDGKTLIFTLGGNTCLA